MCTYNYQANQFVGFLKPVFVTLSLLGAMASGACSDPPRSLETIETGTLPEYVQQIEAFASADGSDLPAVGIIASESATVGRSTYLASNLFVLGTCNGPDCADPDYELQLGRRVHSAAHTMVKAPRMRIGRRARLLGLTEADDFTIGRRAKLSHRHSPLGELPQLPTFLQAEPGIEDINSPTSPLAAGPYGRLTVKRGRQVDLAGGTYAFRDVVIRRRGELRCLEACTILIAEALQAGPGITITGASGHPGDMLIYVASQDGATTRSSVHDPDGSSIQPNGDAQSNVPSGGHTKAQSGADSESKSAAVSIGRSGQVTAEIYAPNGMVAIGRTSLYTGTLIGRWVRLGRRSHFRRGLSRDGLAQFVRAGEAASLKLDDRVTLNLPSCALTEDTVITIAPRLDVPGPILPVGLQIGDDVFDFGPDGLQFECPAELSITYDTSVTEQLGNPEDLAIFYSAEGHSFYEIASTVSSSTQSIQAQIEHFSFYVIGVRGGGRFGRSIVNDGTYLYAANGDLEVYRIVEPNNFYRVGSVSGSFQHVVAQNGYVYTNNFSNAVFMIQVDGSGVPTNQGYITLPYHGAVLKMAAHNNDLLVLQYGRLSVYDITTDPLSPALLATINLEVNSTGVFGYSMHVHDDHAYIGGQDHIVIVDLITRSQVSATAIPEAMSAITVNQAGTGLFGILSSTGVVAYELTNPITPVLQDGLAQASGGQIATAGNMLYTISSSAPDSGEVNAYTVGPGFDIEPAPAGVMSLESPAWPQDFTIYNQQAIYVAAGGAGIVALDISTFHLPQSDWTQAGSALDDSIGWENYDPSLIMVGKTPLVIARESRPNFDSKGNIYLKYFDGTDWVQLGSFINASTNPNYAVGHLPQVVADGHNLFALWRSGVPTKIYGKYFDGTDWLALGDVVNSPGNTQVACMSADIHLGYPMVAYTERIDSGPVHQLYVKRWDGHSWWLVGGMSLNDSVYENIQCASLAVKGEEIFVLGSNGKVKYWDGSSWSQLGPQLSEIIGPSRDIMVYRDDVYIGYNTGSYAQRRLLVRKFNGVHWEQVGPDLDADGFAADISLAQLGEQIYATYTTKASNAELARTVVQKFDGSDWVSVGSPPLATPGRSTSQPQLVFNQFTAWVVHVEGDGGPPFNTDIQVFSAELEPPVPFSVGPPVELTTDPSRFGQRIQLAYAPPPNDRIFATWSQHEPSINVQQLYGQMFQMPGLTPLVGSPYRLSPTNEYQLNDALIYRNEEFILGWTDFSKTPGIPRAVYDTANINGWVFPPSSSLGSFLPRPWSRDVAAVRRNDGQHGVVWIDDRYNSSGDIIVALSSGFGYAPELVITNNSLSKVRPSIASNGLYYLIVWGERASGQTIYYLYVIDENLVRMAGPTAIASTRSPGQIVAASNGDGFLVAWQSQSVDGTGQYALAIQTLNFVGNKTSSVRLLTGRTISERPAVASNGDGYLVTWGNYDPQTFVVNLIAQEFDSIGRPIGIAWPLEVSGPTSGNPSAVWTGSEYVVGWQSSVFTTQSRLKMVEVHPHP